MGHEIDLRKPAKEAEHDIRDIAWSLSMICRFNGHMLRPYSVAEHSLLVCELVEQAGHDVHAQLAALMHDAAEYIMCDPHPEFKVQLLNYYSLEHEWDESIQKSLGYRIQKRHHAIIKHADMVALATEKRDLKRKTTANSPWPSLEGVEPSHRHNLMALNRTVPAANWEHWRDTFLDKYHELVEACDLLETEGQKGFEEASPA
jgi:hypothetical protein